MRETYTHHPLTHSCHQCRNTENCLNSYAYGNHLQQWQSIPNPRLDSRD